MNDFNQTNRSQFQSNKESKAQKRSDFKLIKKWVKPNETVLDLGCERGDLLKLLQKKKKVSTLGIEINTNNVNQCILKGIEVIQANLDDGLDMFDDDSFDLVIMTETIQVLYNPIAVLKEMMRVGKRCIITFPNFAHISMRSYLLLKGRMPVTKQLSYQWYDTPNIHFCTVDDFEETCRKNKIEVLSRKFIGDGANIIVNQFPNLFSKIAIYQLRNRA